jgi:hypothetical protein
MLNMVYYHVNYIIEERMIKFLEVRENVGKREENYIPKPTGTTMAVFFLLCGVIVALRLLLR